jgi:hypothetical protein
MSGGSCSRIRLHAVQTALIGWPWVRIYRLGQHLSLGVQDDYVCAYRTDVNAQSILPF